MDWIYDDYEHKNRLNNIMWTISGDYKEQLDNLDRYTKMSKDMGIYYAVKAGARKKYIDWNLIKRYAAYKIRKGASRDHLISFVEICTDILVEDKMLEERPGIGDIRNDAYDEMFQNFLYHPVNDDLEKIKYALVFEQLGRSAAFDGKTLRLLKEVKLCKDKSDTKDLIQYIDKLYNEYYSDVKGHEEYESDNLIEQVENSEMDGQQGDFSDFLYEELFKEDSIADDISDSIDKLSSSLMIESLGEWQGDGKDTNNRVIYVDEETAKQIYSKIEYYYGKSFMTSEENKNIERKICRNIHEGCRVHFTKGVLRTHCSNMFQVKVVSRHKENNLSYYGQNPRVNKRNIVKLKRTIIQTLIAESETSYLPSERGEIVANKLWRIGRSNNTKIFQKTITNDKGRYVVDILLDASGSQRINQGKVASQAYIISQALTLAKIPNRVMGFNSFLDYTILRRFRDYQSPIEDNENIFEYYAAGNNRDGLAYRAVCEGLRARQEENKILIVLSDGKPNDIKVSKNNQRYIKGEIPYKGIAAIKDTAKEVRRIRAQGILVLGVFTGKEEELYAEKFIYGKDFIYIKNIERFSDIVGTFLKRVIENY